MPTEADSEAAGSVAALDVGRTVPIPASVPVAELSMPTNAQAIPVPLTSVKSTVPVPTEAVEDATVPMPTDAVAAITAPVPIEEI